ncbi:MAG: hypothetical protein KGZ72_00585, partial [Roseovarius sp.]|nr:hypothetical protein [Roseovarius sp.]
GADLTARRAQRDPLTGHKIRDWIARHAAEQGFIARFCSSACLIGGLPAKHAKRAVVRPGAMGIPPKAIALAHRP